MMRMLGQGVALAMVSSALVACGASSPTGPTMSATAEGSAVTVVRASSSDTELEGNVIADGDESTSVTQLVSSL